MRSGVDLPWRVGLGFAVRLWIRFGQSSYWLRPPTVAKWVSMAVLPSTRASSVQDAHRWYGHGSTRRHTREDAPLWLMWSQDGEPRHENVSLMQVNHPKQKTRLQEQCWIMVREAPRPLEAQSVAAGLHSHRVDTASSRTHDYGRQVAATGDVGSPRSRKTGFRAVQDFEVCHEPWSCDGVGFTLTWQAMTL